MADIPQTISVIVPVFNGSQFIGDALKSIDVQTRKPSELIIIIDGCTDDSLEAVQGALLKLAFTFPVTVLETENQGQSAARNLGVRSSSGVLLAFLDQDDAWHPLHLELLCEQFSTTPDLGWSYSDFDEIDQRGLVITRGYIKHHGMLHPKNSIDQLLSADNMVLPAASVLRRSAFDEVGGFDPRLRGYEDDDLFIRMFQAGWVAHFTEKPLLSYRVHTGGSSGNNSFRASRMIFFDKLIAHFSDDYQMHRLYITDLLIPRMVASTVAEYSFALRTKRYDEARSIADSVRTLMSAKSKITVRQRLGISLLRRPRLCAVVLALRRSLPRFLKPRLPAAAVFRD